VVFSLFFGRLKLSLSGKLIIVRLALKSFAIFDKCWSKKSHWYLIVVCADFLVTSKFLVPFIGRCDAVENCLNISVSYVILGRLVLHMTTLSLSITDDGKGSILVLIPNQFLFAALLCMGTL